jgi:hypothetical protein
MIITSYTEPVSKLLYYGDCRHFTQWPDYLKLDFSKEHIPALIRMATDKELNWGDSNSLEVWAPTHAWRALAQLHAEDAIVPLLQLFHELKDDDLAVKELPIIYQMIGPKAVPALMDYIAEDSHGVHPRITATQSIKCIAKAYPKAREPCLLVLQKQLERFRENDPAFNGFLIGYIIDLQAVELLPLIQRAFDCDCVDVTIAGDVEDVEIELGVRTHRSTPQPVSPLHHLLEPILEQVKTQQRTKKQKIGRNAPCSCGSGRKYKKCCLKKQM